jgi:hypothetical protein
MFWSEVFELSHILFPFFSFFNLFPGAMFWIACFVSSVLYLNTMFSLSIVSVPKP